jgi:anti-anti-sigma factor
MRFSFSDLIAGYVAGFDTEADTFQLRTRDGRTFEVRFTAVASAELMRNLNEPYIDCSGKMREMLTPGRYVYVYGIFYPEGDDTVFDAKHIVFAGRAADEFRPEEKDWWVKQVRSLAEFYLHAQFPDGNVDYREYSTLLSLYGDKLGSNLRQETDTISRMVYGFASAYLMTGEDRYLEAAEKGTEYLREHMRWRDDSEGIAYWYHGIELSGRHEKKILASQFGDDYDAIPAYEQIYALAGPAQTFRVTGDPAIARDIEMTVNFFERYFLDRAQGGYFSHLDPITFDPRADSLGQDRARKNWNSVGDHAPAYLINAYLATGDQRYADMLAYCFDQIVEHFPDYAHSPFVQEKFFEDWSHDQTWFWQQNRGVVGHNLKIAWNLMRMHSLKPEQRYKELAEQIAEVMPPVGSDQQRGGWYDVMERALAPGQEFYRHVWHDRKAWWQQEQAILAYLILSGTLKKPEYLALARESTAFYNAWFLDHDSGAVYFNVQANGLPYLLGNERMKGSHSMSGYHSFELCYLSAVYTNLLITKQPMDFYFKPKAGGFRDNTLRVAPDLLPLGSVRIGGVWINGEEHRDFDAERLTVKLPATGGEMKVRVQIIPDEAHEHFNASLEQVNGTVKLVLNGELDPRAVPVFRAEIERLVQLQPKTVVLMAENLSYLSPAGLRAIAFARQKLDIDDDLYVVGAQEQVRKAFEDSEVAEEITHLDAYDPTKLH